MVGAFIGFLYGVVGAILYYVVMLPFLMKLFPLILTNESRFAANPRVPEFVNLLTNIMYYVGLLIVPVEAIIGCVFGVIFVALKDKIPGRTTIHKAVLYSLVLFAVQIIYSTLRALSAYWISPEIARLMNTPQVVSLIKTTDATLPVPVYAITLATHLSLGFLFGYLLDRRLSAK